MNARRATLAVLAVAAPGLVLATRAPGGAMGLVASALAVACALAGLVAASRPWRWAPPLALALGVALLVVPPSRSAVLPDVPAPVLALVLLVLFHFLYPLDANATPRLPGSRTGIGTVLPRILPLLLLAGFLASTAILLGLLPDRLASSRELAGPLGPIVVGLLAATVTAAMASAKAARSALARRRAARDGDADGSPLAEGTP